MPRKQSIKLIPSPAKRCRRSDFDYETFCIICQGSDTTESLVKPTPKGKTTLHRRMRQTDDEAYRSAKASGVLDDAGFLLGICYHRRCYQSYTSAENISHKYKSQADQSLAEISGSSGKEQSSSMKTRHTSTPFAMNKCIICNCIKKKGVSALIQVRTFQVQNSIQSAAISLDDTDLLRKVQSQDLIALEAKYHKNCLGNLLTRAGRTAITTDKADESSYVFTKAFAMLLDGIEDDLNHGRAYDMSFLLATYRGHLTTCGHVDSGTYRGEKLKKRLIKHFESSITFHKGKEANKPELVYSSNIDLKDTINKIAD